MIVLLLIIIIPIFLFMVWTLGPPIIHITIGAWEDWKEILKRGD